VATQVVALPPASPWARHGLWERQGRPRGHRFLLRPRRPAGILQRVTPLAPDFQNRLTLTLEVDMTRVTQAAFARQHEVSRAAVGKWKSGGYITIIDDLVAVELSDARLRDYGLGRYNPAPPSHPGAVNLSTAGKDPTAAHVRAYPVASLASLLAFDIDGAYLAARQHVPVEVARAVAEAVVARACESAIECLDADGPNARPPGYASWRAHPWFVKKPMSEEEWLELEAWHCRGSITETDDPVIQLPANWGGPTRGS
jgi:hypothetical protein